jgi:tetratricopeptide (TPR) repeat protein
MKFALDKGAGDPRAGSYSLSGRKVSSDKIAAAAIAHSPEAAEASRGRVSSARIPAAYQDSSFDAVPYRKKSSKRIPVADAVPYRKKSSKRIPAAASTPAAKASLPRDGRGEEEPQAENRVPLDSVARRRRASSQTRLEFVNPATMRKGNARIPDAQVPRELVTPQRRAASQQIPAVSPLKSVAVGEAPPDVRDRIREALRHIAHKQYDPAIGELEKALETEPGNVEAIRWLLVCRARKLMGEGQREAAVEVYQKLIEMDRNNYEATKEVGSFQKEQTMKAVPFGRYFVKGSGSPEDGSGGRPRKKSKH